MLARKKPLKNHSTWKTDIAILTGLLFIFYTFWLGGYPLFTPDEGRYSEVAREMIATGDYITPRVNGVAFLDKPILHYWLQTIALSLFGLKEWAARIFPALSGVLGCIVTYICGRRLFDRRTGLVSAIILATTPLYFASAHYANIDLEVAVLVSCTLLFFITGAQAEDESRSYFLFLAYLSAALAFLLKGLIGIAFPAMIAGTWIMLSSQWKLLIRIHLIKGIILFLLITLPWFILVQKANPEFLHYFFVTQQFSRFVSSGEFNNPTPFWFYLPVILIGFFPWSGFIIPALGKAIQNRKQQTELYLLLWLIIIFIFFSIPRSKTITYILPVFPALALLTGKYLSDAWEAAREKASILIIFTVGIFLAIGLLSLDHFHWTDLSGHFKPYLKTLGYLCLVGASLTLLLIRQKRILPIFTLITTWSALFLLILTVGTTHLNQDTSKPLVTTLKTIIKPEDEVIAYFKFYYDVPFYLEKRMTIVANWKSPNIPYNDNWVREFWYGMPFQNTEEWLIDEDKFWGKWNSENRVFVFLNENYFDQFKLRATSYYYLGDNKDIILLSNKPTHIRD